MKYALEYFCIACTSVRLDEKRANNSPPLAREDGLVEDGAVGAEEGDPARAVALVQADVVPLAAHVRIGVVTWRAEGAITSIFKHVQVSFVIILISFVKEIRKKPMLIRLGTNLVPSGRI